MTFIFTMIKDFHSHLTSGLRTETTVSNYGGNILLWQRFQQLPPGSGKTEIQRCRIFFNHYESGVTWSS